MSKIVTINEANYQINRMSAKTGSWLLMLLMGKLVKIMQEQETNNQPIEETPATEETKNGEAAASAAIQFMLMNLDEETFIKVQKHSLGVVYKLEGERQLPVPIAMADGRFALRELESDIATVMQLTSQSLFFNLSPFFTAGKLTGLLQTQ